MADRYTYLPMIGPVTALVWLVADLASPSVNRRFAVSVAGVLAVSALGGIAAWQTTYWRDDFTLWTRDLSCTANNCIAPLHIGLAYNARKQFYEAAKQYEEALRIYPDLCVAHFDLACALSSLGQNEAAQRHYEKALALHSDYVEAHNNFGMLLMNRGNIAAAAEHFQSALDVEPGHAMAQNNLGLTLMATGQYAAAAEHYRRAIALDPDFPQPHANLGHALGQLGEASAAVAELRTFLQMQPDNATALGWLAWVLATTSDDAVRNGPQAVELARKAAELSHGSDPRILDALAAAYAATGQFTAAVSTASSARDLALSSGQRALAGTIEERIELYRRGQPFRQ